MMELLCFSLIWQLVKLKSTYFDGILSHVKEVCSTLIIYFKYFAKIFHAHSNVLYISFFSYAREFSSQNGKPISVTKFSITPRN